MKSSRKNPNGRIHARGVLAQLSSETAALFPVAAAVYLGALFLRVAGRLDVSPAIWTATSVVVSAAALLALPTYVLPGEGRERLLKKVFSIRSAFSAFGWSDYAKGALFAGLLSIAFWQGAGIIGLLTVAFGCMAALFSVVAEKKVYLLALVLLLAIPLVQAAGFKDAANAVAVYAFEAFAIAVATSALKSKKES